MLTKTQFGNFRNQFAKAVTSLEKDFGIKIELGSISYNADSFHVKMNCTKTGDNGEKVFNIEKFNHLKKICGFLGNYGDEYTQGNITYKVVDIDLRKPKNCIQLKGSNGANYKASANAVNFFLKLS